MINKTSYYLLAPLFTLLCVQSIAQNDSSQTRYRWKCTGVNFQLNTYNSGKTWGDFAPNAYGQLTLIDSPYNYHVFASMQSGDYKQKTIHNKWKSYCFNGFGFEFSFKNLKPIFKKYSLEYRMGGCIEKYQLPGLYLEWKGRDHYSEWNRSGFDKGTFACQNVTLGLKIDVLFNRVIKQDVAIYFGVGCKYSKVITLLELLDSNELQSVTNRPDRNYGWDYDYNIMRQAGLKCIGGIKYNLSPGLNAFIEFNAESSLIWGNAGTLFNQQLQICTGITAKFGRGHEKKIQAAKFRSWR